MKAHFINPSSPITIIGFIATIKLECDTNNIYEGEFIRVLPFFFTNVLATTLNSRISAAAQITPVVASVNNTEQLI